MSLTPKSESKFTPLEASIADLINGVYSNDGTMVYEPEPFYGRLIATLRRRFCLNEDKDKTPWFTPTCAVALIQNDITLIINEDFFNTLERFGRRAVLKHEAQHVTHRHLFRFKRNNYKNMMRGNIAMDASINQYNAPIYDMKNPDYDPTVTDPNDPRSHKKFQSVHWNKIPEAKENMTWEMYYALLEKDFPESDPNSGDAQAYSKYGQSIDDHSFFGKDDGESSPEAAEGQLNETIQRIARQCYAGNNPKEIQDILDEIYKESKISWRTLLRNWFSQSIAYERKQSILRESISVEGVFPGFKREPKPEFHIYADMSGSIANDQAEAFFNECMSIQKGLKAVINIHQFDTRIHKSERLEKKPPKIVRAACGGTNFDCIVEHARENKIKHLVVMTDGYCPESDWTGLNVLFAYTENHQEHQGRKKVVIDET